MHGWSGRIVIFVRLIGICMNNLKTHKLIRRIAVIMMLLCCIFLIINYSSGAFLGHKWGWIGLAVMALIVMYQSMIISDIRRREDR